MMKLIIINDNILGPYYQIKSINEIYYHITTQTIIVMKQIFNNHQISMHNKLFWIITQTTLSIV